MTIYYAQGPLLARPEWDEPDVPNYKRLAIFKTEVALKGAPKGVMARTSAAVCAEHGKGRVFCFSPHPEFIDGLHHLNLLTVRWAATKEGLGNRVSVPSCALGWVIEAGGLLRKEGLTWGELSNWVGDA